MCDLRAQKRAVCMGGTGGGATPAPAGNVTSQASAGGRSEAGSAPGRASSN